MTRVLGPNDLGWLKLVLNFFKCLNLNSIMIGALGPDDLGWLTLVLNSFKCLKLKFNHDWSLRTRWFGLVNTHSKYLNLNLSVLLKIPIWVSYTYCYPATFEDAYPIYALWPKSWTYNMSCLPNMAIHTIQIRWRWHQISFPLFIMAYEVKGTYFH